MWVGSERARTLSLDKESQQGVCGGHGLAEVLIVIDGEEVSVNIGISNHHLHVCNPVDCHDEFVEFLKFAGF